MKRPGHADQGVEEPAVRLDVVEQAENAVAANDDQAIKREKIWGQGNPEIVAVGDDVTAFATDAEPADASAHKQDPDSVRELVAENINQHRARQTEERDQPEDRA